MTHAADVMNSQEVLKWDVELRFFHVFKSTGIAERAGQMF